MNKQLLTLGLALSFATTACTGLGIQASPTLAVFEEQGLSNLWDERTDEALDPSMQVGHRDERQSADLWMKADRNPDWNRDSAEDAPRAAGILEKLMLTNVSIDGIVGSKINSRKPEGGTDESLDGLRASKP